MAREWISGRNAVVELLRAGRRRVFRLCLARGATGSRLNEAERLARDLGVPVETVDSDRLDALADGDQAQGVAVETGGYPYVPLERLLHESTSGDEPPFLLVSAGIQDPQNLGSLLRTGDAAGIHGAVLPRRRAVGITPAVVRVSSGAAEHLAVSQAGNLVQTIKQLKEAGLWIFGGHPEGGDRYDEADLSGPVAVVIGSEGDGLPRLVREHCDGLLTIPQQGRVASLNAAVAGALLLYAVRSWRDRRT